MKKIILLICMIFTLSFSSCVVGEYATTQDDLYVETYSDVVESNVDINVILTHGTPYYYEGAVLYYLYNGLYYYPFYYDNYWYMRVYRRPFNHLYYRPYFRPNRHDYKFSRDFRQPQGWRSDPGHPHNSNRFGQSGNRPRPQRSPDTMPQQSNTRQQVPNQNDRIVPQQENRNGRFGGSRSNNQQTRPTTPQRNVTPVNPSRGVSTPNRGVTPSRSGGASGRSGNFGGGRR